MVLPLIYKFQVAEVNIEQRLEAICFCILILIFLVIILYLGLFCIDGFYWWLSRCSNFQNLPLNIPYEF